MTPPISALMRSLAIVACLTPSVALANRGGPDAYGRTFVDSTEMDGPTYEWVDITTVGTRVTGLTDDNSVAGVSLSGSFPYYGSRYTQVTIGSNGWVGFDNVTNIAHCFPTIPQPGGSSDNYLAVLMSDLNLAGAGNPGAVYTYRDEANNRFIISYVDVPFWVNGTPDWTGSNTFQVLLYDDGVIVMQYQSLSAFANTGGCSSDLQVGIEGADGSAGLSNFTDAQPSTPLAIRFELPVAAPDLSTSARSLTDLNGGQLVPGDEVEVRVDVTNTGSGEAWNVTLEDALPVGTTYVQGSLLRDGSTVTDGPGDDVGEFVPGSMSVVFRLGSGATDSNGGTLAPAAMTTIRYRVLVSAEAGDEITSGAGDELRYAFVGPELLGIDGDPATPGVQPASLAVDHSSVSADAGVPDDAGISTDAGLSDGGTEPSDAGVLTDAGVLVDAGSTPMDAGARNDAGAPMGGGGCVAALGSRSPISPAWLGLVLLLAALRARRHE
ncbi:MAG: DUF11 domain-containing protein [Sandaracinaceae bacterium]|nr:DUF11 domain-containing protein [Sandaracinaceae bacterium]